MSSIDDDRFRTTPAPAAEPLDAPRPPSDAAPPPAPAVRPLDAPIDVPDDVPTAAPLEPSAAAMERLAARAGEADATDAQRADAPRAHFFARVAAWLLDAIVLGAMNAALVWIAASAVIVAERFIGHNMHDADEVVSAIAYAGSIGLAGGYFVVLHTGEGQTIGKATLGIRVQRTNGAPLGLARSALRWCGYVLSAIPLGLGFLWAMLPPRRAWHDYLAGTVVVRV